MSLSTQSSRVEYVAEDAQDTFAFPFRVFEATDVQIFQNGSLLNSSQYAVTGVNEAGGGNLILSAPAEAGDEIIILSAIAYDQQISYSPGGPFPASSHEKGLDKQARLSQQLKEITTRCLQLNTAKSFGLSNLELPHPDSLTLAAGGKKFLSWNDVESNLTLREIAPADDAVGLLSSTVDTSTVASLPAPGVAGRVRRASDAGRGLRYDNGSQWVRTSPLADFRDWNCDLTGNTDETSNLAGALAEVTTAGFGLFLPAGTLMLAGQVGVSARAWLVGAGQGRTILKRDTLSSQDMFEAQVVDGLYMADMTLDGNAANATLLGMGVRLNGCSNVLIERLTVLHAGQDGVYCALDSSTGSTLCEQVTVRNCRLHACKRNGLAVVAGNHIHFEGNHITEVTTFGIDVEPNTQAGAFAHHVWIVGNFIYTVAGGVSGQTGISVQMRDSWAGAKTPTYEQVSNFWVLDNFVRDTVGEGISITDAAAVRVRGNTVHGCNVGINLTATANVSTAFAMGRAIVAENICYSNTLRGMRIFKNSGAHDFRGLLVRDNISHTNGTFGLTLGAGVLDGMAYGNILFSNSSGDLDVTTGSGWAVGLHREGGIDATAQYRLHRPSNFTTSFTFTGESIAAGASNTRLNGTGNTAQTFFQDVPVGFNGAVVRVAARLSAAPGAGQSCTVNVQINGAGTALALVISDTSQVGSTTDEADVAATSKFVATQRLGVVVSTSAGAATTHIVVTVSVTPFQLT